MPLNQLWAASAVDAAPEMLRAASFHVKLRPPSVFDSQRYEATKALGCLLLHCTERDRRVLPGLARRTQHIALGYLHMLVAFWRRPMMHLCWTSRPGKSRLLTRHATLPWILLAPSAACSGAAQLLSPRSRFRCVLGLLDPLKVLLCA